MVPAHKIRLRLSLELGIGDDLALRLIKALVTRCGATISKCRPRALLALLLDKKPVITRVIHNEINKNLMTTPALPAKPKAITEREMPLVGNGD